MAATAAPVTNGATHAVVKGINQYRHKRLRDFRDRGSDCRSPNYWPLGCWSAGCDSGCGAIADSGAGAAILLFGPTPFPFLLAPLAEGFFMLFLPGFAFFASFSAVFFSAFFCALFTGFSRTFLLSSPSG